MLVARVFQAAAAPALAANVENAVAGKHGKILKAASQSVSSAYVRKNIKNK